MPRKPNASMLLLSAIERGEVSTAELLVNLPLIPLMIPYKGSRPLITKPIRFGRKEKLRVHTMLARLKREGLVAISGSSRKHRWSLTVKGLARVAKFKNQEPYRKEPSKEVLVVSYDIPENQRRERAWLRSVLSFLEFECVQKSVWIGKVALPEEFISDIEKREISEFVQIFSIGKAGTLKKANP